MAQEIPMLSKLLRSIIIGDYATALKTVKDNSFNPNDTHLSWGAPVMSAIINVIGDSSLIANKKEFKDVVVNILRHDNFNPNMTDNEGDTILMHIAKHPSFNWAVPYILSNPKTDITIKNFTHRNANNIASICGNTEFIDIWPQFFIM